MIHVLIPTYNRSAFITEAIDSVINQKFESWKISIVDNDSTDNTESLIRKKYKRLLNKKIFYYKHNIFVSATHNWNRSLKYINREKYFMILCSDDYLHPNFFAEGMQILQSNKTYNGYCSSVMYFEGSIKKNKRSYGFFGFEFWASLLFRNYAGIPSSTILKSSDFKNMKFQEISYAGDLFFILRALLAGKKIYYDSKVLSYYRCHPSSDSAINYGSLRMIRGKYKFRMKILKEILKFKKNVIFNYFLRFIARLIFRLIAHLECIFFCFIKK